MPDEFVFEEKAPAAEAALHPALRGVSNDARSGVVGVSHKTKSLGLLGGTDRVFRQSAGVYGESVQQGVFGHSTDSAGTGVYGSSVGAGFGVRGESAEGIAVKGQSFGTGIAVQGIGGRLAGHFEGDVEITRNLNVGVDVILAGADCAEDFDIAGFENVESGTVMVIDEEGALRISDQPYDKKVAGVISGAGEYKPGLILDRKRSKNDRKPIALIGKAYCKVDVSYGAIEVGDLLTTSPTPGHAMKADDPMKAFGSVIGKALRPLREGQGLIPILIALQ
jgi:hypothetical protein